jgi:hypothetical protein
MKQSLRRIILGTSLLANVLLIPVLVNNYLGFVYAQTFAHWISKITPPNTVYIGDSLTAGGHSFNHRTDINLGSNGLITYQIASLLPTARAYKSDHIVVMAGTNDAMRGPINEEEIRNLWAGICSDQKVVVILAPQTRSPSINERLDTVREIVKPVCETQKRPIISLDVLTGDDGLIKPEYTVDGTHLTPTAYDILRERLREKGI